MEASTAQKTHPLVITAAVAVTAVSLAGIGAIFGLIPTGNSAKAPATPPEIHSTTTTPAAPAVAPASANATLSLPAGSSVRIDTAGDTKHRAEAVAKARHQPAREAARDERPAVAAGAPVAAPLRVANDEPPSIYVERAERPVAEVRPAASPTCRDCGTIAGIREVSRAGDPNGVGAVAGGVLGGIVGRQIGNGRGRDAMTVLGALGGAYAGHQVEKTQRSSREYEITVRYDDGTTQVFPQPTAPGWRQGERVRVSGGQISAL